MVHNLHLLTLLQQPGIAYHLLLDGYLFEGFGMHEIIGVLILLVHELVRAALHTGQINLDARRESMLQSTACLEVFQFGTHEGGSFSRFHMQELDNAPYAAVHFYAQSIFEICCCRHITQWLEMLGSFFFNTGLFAGQLAQIEYARATDQTVLVHHNAFNKGGMHRENTLHTDTV